MLPDSSPEQKNDIMEELILEQLLMNPEYYKKVVHLLKKEYFKEAQNRIIFAAIQAYSNKFLKAPTLRELEIIVSNRRDVNEEVYKRVQDFLNSTRESTQTPDLQWMIENTEKYCQVRSAYNAVYECMDIIDGKDKSGRTIASLPEIFQKVTQIGFDVDTGENYLQDAMTRWENLHSEKIKTTTGINILDTATLGGWEPGTLNVFMALTGAGKTLVMVNNTTQCLLHGLNVLYISGEVSQSKINQRVDANLLDMPIYEVAQMDKQKFLNALSERTRKVKNMGTLYTKEYPTSSANVMHIRNLMDELQMKKGFVPDIIFLDYLNIFESAKVGKNAGLFEKVKSIAEEFRALAQEKKIPIVTATQTNRSGVEKQDVRMDAISESFGVIATADWLAAIIRTEEYDKVDQMMIKQLKSRYDDYTKMERMMVMVDRVRQKVYNLGKDKKESSFLSDLKPKKTYDVEGILDKVETDSKIAFQKLKTDDIDDEDDFSIKDIQ